mgnify:CR=1
MLKVKYALYWVLVSGFSSNLIMAGLFQLLWTPIHKSFEVGGVAERRFREQVVRTYMGVIVT